MIEYAPQDAPAITISAAPAGSGDVAPGSVSQPSPPAARSNPAQSRASGRSPLARPVAIIVTCTAPKSSSAPTPAPMRVYATVNATA